MTHALPYDRISEMRPNAEHPRHRECFNKPWRAGDAWAELAAAVARGWDRHMAAINLNNTQGELDQAWRDDYWAHELDTSQGDVAAWPQSL